MPELDLLGQYECKVDAKGRVRIPRDLLGQFPEGESKKFVLNRGVDGHIAMFPFKIWEKTSSKVNALNQYKKANRDFKRYFFRGAIEIEVDGNDRILVPKRLLEYGQIEKEITVLAYGDNIEIWSKDLFESNVNQEPDDFSEMAEDVLGDIEDMS